MHETIMLYVGKILLDELIKVVVFYLVKMLITKLRSKKNESVVGGTN